MNIQTKANVQIKQVCVQLPIYADNVALPAFASRCSSNRSMSPARPMLGQTDGRTHGRTPCRLIDLAPHTMRAVPANYSTGIYTMQRIHVNITQ